MDNKVIEYLKSLSSDEQDKIFDVVKSDKAVTEKDTAKEDVVDNKEVEPSEKEDKIDNEQKVEDKETETEEVETKADDSKDETDNSESNEEKTEDKATDEEVTEETAVNEVVDDAELIDLDNIVQKDYLQDVLGDKFGSVDSRFSALEQKIDSLLERFVGDDFGNDNTKNETNGISSKDSWETYKQKFM